MDIVGSLEPADRNNKPWYLLTLTFSWTMLLKGDPWLT